MCICYGVACFYLPNGFAVPENTTFRLSVIASSLFCVAAPVAYAQQATQSQSELAPVIVTSSRIDRPLLETPASVSVIDGDTMRDSLQQVNLSESLNSVPGLMIQNRNNYAQDLQISMRGFGARSTFGMRGMRMYIDGIPATMPDGQGQSSNVDIASISHIEVMKGPFSALYGNSAGGVIQVFTEPGKGPFNIDANVSYGSNNAKRIGLQASGGTNNTTGLTDYRISASKFDTDGYRDHSSTTKYQGNAKLGFALNDRNTLAVTANTVDIKADDPLGLTQEMVNANPRGVAPVANQYNTRKTVKQTQLGLVWDSQINANNSLKVTTYAGNRQTVQYLAIPPGPQNNQKHSGGVIDLARTYAGVDVRWTGMMQLASRPLTLTGGLAYDWMGEDRKGYENFIGSTLGVQGKIRRDERNKSWNLDPYVQASWGFADNWTWDLGVRYSSLFIDSSDHYLQNGDDGGSVSFNQVLPVTALRYALSKDASVYATLGRGYESPTFNELSYRLDDSGTAASGMNFGLKPSVNTNAEIGIKANTDWGNVGAALFKTWTRDEIVVLKNEGGRTYYKNGGNTKRQGLELSWDKTFARSAKAQLAYTLMQATMNNDGTTLPGVAKNMFFASLAWAPKTGWQAGGEYRVMSKVYATAKNDAYAPGYATTSLYTGYKAEVQKWTLGAFVRVDNVFDRNYIGSVIVNDNNKRYYEPAQGRNWLMSVSANYQF